MRVHPKSAFDTSHLGTDLQVNLDRLHQLASFPDVKAEVAAIREVNPIAAAAAADDQRVGYATTAQEEAHQESLRAARAQEEAHYESWRAAGVQQHNLRAAATVQASQQAGQIAAATADAHQPTQNSDDHPSREPGSASSVQSNIDRPNELEQVIEEQAQRVVQSTKGGAEAGDVGVAIAALDDTVREVINDRQRDDS